MNYEVCQNISDAQREQENNKEEDKMITISDELANKLMEKYYIDKDYREEFKQALSQDLTCYLAEGNVYIEEFAEKFKTDAKINELEEVIDNLNKIKNSNVMSYVDKREIIRISERLKEKLEEEYRKI
ncbi:MAG: hypothetical protein ACOCRX_08290 [Candidatus Woesearchaeota archaeon]